MMPGSVTTATRFAPKRRIKSGKLWMALLPTTFCPGFMNFHASFISRFANLYQERIQLKERS